MENELLRRKLASKITLLAVVALSASPWTRAESGQGYVLAAYSDAAGGQQLLSGQYSAALVSIHSDKGTSASMDAVRHTNACVAFAMMRKLNAARTACDAAVVAATADRSHAKGVVSRSRSQEDSAVAIAYSNRAIVHSLLHEAVGFTEDLAEANSLAPQSDFVVRNIAVFKQVPVRSMQLAITAQRMED
jgi:hypothetical protein